jgi:hypothetical protein
MAADARKKKKKMSRGRKLAQKPNLDWPSQRTFAVLANAGRVASVDNGNVIIATAGLLEPTNVYTRRDGHMQRHQDLSRLERGASVALEKRCGWLGSGACCKRVRR